jgi:hypothetical protein
MMNRMLAAYVKFLLSAGVRQARRFGGLACDNVRGDLPDMFLEVVLSTGDLNQDSVADHKKLQVSNRHTPRRLTMANTMKTSSDPKTFVTHARMYSLKRPTLVAVTRKIKLTTAGAGPRL